MHNRFSLCPRPHSLFVRLFTAAMIAGAPFFLMAAPASADVPEVILHKFTGANGDGAGPGGGFALSPDGNYYATVSRGGAYGGGAVFRLSPSGAITYVHNFANPSRAALGGSLPSDTLTIEPDGMIYGTTAFGGPGGFGTVYKLAPDGIETVLHSFQPGPDCNVPTASVTLGGDGILYGTTSADYSGQTYTPGTIYSVHTDGTDYHTQFRFTQANSYTYGGFCDAILLPGPNGTFYGTNNLGGINNGGSVFAFTPGPGDLGGSIQVLHLFNSNEVQYGDGYEPGQQKLQIDSDGNLYGTVLMGGRYHGGAVFKLAPDDSIALIHDFTAPTPGTPTGSSKYPYGPGGSLMLASDGNYYGVLAYGGTNQTGAVYRISQAGKFSVVYNFGPMGSGDGINPAAKVLEDSDGNLIGMTSQGGIDDTGNHGVIYKLMTRLPNPVKVASLTATPTLLTGGSEKVFAKLTLNRPVPSTGAIIKLVSTDPRAANVPSLLKIPAGATGATFVVNSQVVGSAVKVPITASYNDSTAQTDLAVTPQPSEVSLTALALTPKVVEGGGGAALGRVYLTGDAVADTPVTLTSSDPSVAQVTQSAVTVKAGFSSRVFTIQTYAVNSTRHIVITATSNGQSHSETLTVTH